MFRRTRTKLDVLPAEANKNDESSVAGGLSPISIADTNLDPLSPRSGHGSPADARREADAETELRAMVKILKKHPEQYKQVFVDFCNLIPEQHNWKLKAVEPKILSLVLRLLESDVNSRSSERRLLMDVMARLLRAKTLFKTIQKHGVDPLISALNDDDEQVVLSALNVAKHIVTFKGFTTAKNVKEMIQINKALFHGASGFVALTQLLKQHTQADGSRQVLKSTLELFSSILCSETETLQYDCVRNIMELLKPIISSLLRQSYCSDTVIAYHSTVLIQCLLLHSNMKTHDKIQRSALRMGCFLKHLFIAVHGHVDFTDEKLPPLVGECDSRIQHESQMLIGLLVDGYSDASDALSNALPARLIGNYIRLPHKFEYRFQFMNILAQREWLETTAYHRYSKNLLKRENWMAVFHAIKLSFSEPDLIWNEVTRQELLTALRSELREFQCQQSVMASSEWHWEGFEVLYPSLGAELKCAGYYVRLLLPALELDVPFDIPNTQLRPLIMSVYNRAVIEDKMNWKLGCLRLISTLFRIYPKELSVLEPLPYIVWLLDPKHTHPLWRDHILNFLATLLMNPRNAKEFIRSGGLSHLEYYISDIHRKRHHNNSVDTSGVETSHIVDTSQIRISVPHHKTSSITSLASLSSSHDVAGRRSVSHSHSSATHIQKPPSVRSSPSRSLTPAFDETKSDIDPAAATDCDILETLETPMSQVEVTQASIALVRLLCQRLPRLKKSISRHKVFQSLVQALICGEAAIIADVTCVLMYIIQDNSYAVPRLATTALFIYLVYCTKTECTPNIAKLMHWYHGKQNNEFVKPDESALSFMLPVPLIKVLDNEGPGKFMEYLNDGAVERPDLIWNNSVRQILYSHISKLVADIRAQLADNPQCSIQYRSYDPIVYECLDRELCVAGIYVRVFNEQSDFQLRDPPIFMNGLLDFMKRDLSNDYLKELLNAQITMVRRFPSLSNAREYPCFEILLSIIGRPIESDEDRLVVSSASDLAYFLLTMKTETDNRSRCVNSCGVHEMSAAILQLISKGLDVDDGILGTMLKFLSILNMLCYKNPPALAIIIDQNELFIELSRMIDLPFVERFPDISLSAMQAITTLVSSASLLKKFVENGAILFVINIVMFHNDESEETSRLISAAGKCLAAMSCKEPEFLLQEHAGGIDSPEAQCEFHAHLRNILRSLLTPGLYMYVRDPLRFTLRCHENFETPLLIWNDQTRDELRQYFREQFPEIRETGIWKSSVFFFTYSTLRHDVALGAGEIIVGDIYLRLYNENNGERIEIQETLESRGQFLIELLHAIQNCSEALKEMEAEKHKSVAFAYLNVVGQSITRLISEYPILLEQYDDEMEYLSKLLVSPIFDSQQSVLIVFRCLADSPQTIGFVSPNVLQLHALLNLERESVELNPSIDLILDLLIVLCRDEKVLSGLCDSGILVSILWILGSSELFTRSQRLKSAHLLGTMVDDEVSGNETRSVCQLLLTVEFDKQIVGAVHDPEMLIEYFDQDHDSPVIFWNDGCRRDLLKFLELELSSIRDHQSVLLEGTSRGEQTAPFGWITKDIPERFVKNTLSSQLCIDDIYIHALNANPFYPVSTETFWPKLIEGLRREFAFYCHVRDLSIRESEQSGTVFDADNPNDQSGGIDHALGNLTALWESLRNLLSNQPAMQTECISDLPYFFSYFHPLVNRPLQLIALDTVKSLSTNPDCAQSVVRSGLLKDVLPLLVTLENDSENLIKVLDLVENILRRSSEAVEQVRLLGGLVIILKLLLDSKYSEEIRFKASHLISAMAQDKQYGSIIIAYVAKFLTASFRTKFTVRPDRLIQFIESDHESSRDKRLWNQEQKRKLCDLLEPEGRELIRAMMEWDRKSELWRLSKLNIIWPDSVLDLYNDDCKENHYQIALPLTPKLSGAGGRRCPETIHSKRESQSVPSKPGIDEESHHHVDGNATQPPKFVHSDHDESSRTESDSESSSDIEKEPDHVRVPTPPLQAQRQSISQSSPDRIVTVSPRSSLPRANNEDFDI
uniref:DnaJ homologue subfamily C GRV2/DNAJC13 N-terminal domain-containing protein n=1 Tax=Hirondellea gigas TaxID=1518452 RepID=A0A6A7FQV3_9CRUS